MIDSVYMYWTLTFITYTIFSPETAIPTITGSAIAFLQINDAWVPGRCGVKRRRVRFNWIQTRSKHANGQPWPMVLPCLEVSRSILICLDS